MNDPRCEACPAKLFVSMLAGAMKDLCPKEQLVDKLISPTEAAKRLNISRRSLDRQRRTFSFVRERPSGRGYDVSERALTEWLRG